MKLYRLRDGKMKIFKDENIQLNQYYENKIEAILAAGKILVENGYVDIVG